VHVLSSSLISAILQTCLHISHCHVLSLTPSPLRPLRLVRRCGNHGPLDTSMTDEQIARRKRRSHEITQAGPYQAGQKVCEFAIYMDGRYVRTSTRTDRRTETRGHTPFTTTTTHHCCTTTAANKNTTTTTTTTTTTIAITDTSTNTCITRGINLTSARSCYDAPALRWVSHE
jgi:hypothetical protein